MGRHVAWWHDIKSPRVQEVVRRVNNREPLSLIAPLLGVKNANVASWVIRRLRAEHPLAFKPLLLTKKEAAKFLGVLEDKLLGLVSPVDPLRELFSYADLERSLALIGTRVRCCERCSDQLPKDAPLQRMCARGTQCFKERGRDYQRSREARYSQEEATSETLRGWLKELYERRAEYVTPPEDRWVKHAEALRLSGLRQIQLTWARKRGLLKTRSTAGNRRHPTMFLYAASEMEFVCKVYTQWQQGRQPASTKSESGAEA